MSLNMIPPTIIANAASSAASFNSTATHVMYSDNIGIQISWTGTTTGTFAIQASNDAVLPFNGGAPTGGTWSTYTVTSPPTPAGTAGNGIITVNQFPFAFIRLAYTATSGTGTITAVLTAKPV
jgi:hypothetical protein